MRHTLRFLLLAVAVLPAVAHADSLFTLNGTLNDGTVASGTISINTVTGATATSNLTFTNGATVYTLNTTASTQTYAGFEYLDFNDGNVRSEIEINLASLIGYTGGSLCTLIDRCPGGNASNFFGPGVQGQDAPNYITGTLTPVAATPEPSSLIFLGTGLFGVVGIARRKLSA